MRKNEGKSFLHLMGLDQVTDQVTLTHLLV